MLTTPEPTVAAIMGFIVFAMKSLFVLGNFAKDEILGEGR